MSKRELGLYLTDIIDAVTKIDSYIHGFTFRQFCNDEKTLDAVMRNFSIIGEAVNNIPVEIKQRHPHIYWGGIIGMRNKVIHEYFGVDPEIMWETIKLDLPDFKKQIIILSRELK